MHTRSRRRSEYYENAQKRTLRETAPEAVRELGSTAVRRAAGAAESAKGFAGRTVVGRAAGKVAGKVADSTVGKTVGHAASSVAGKVAGVATDAVHAAPGVARAGVETVKSGAEKVKSGVDVIKSDVHKIDEKIPFYHSREYHREVKRGDKEAKKQRKAEKSSSKRMRGWNAQYYEEGSAEYQAHLDELCMNILKEQKSFIDYSTDMQAWLDERAAKEKSDEQNERYCRNMFDYCISPLQHGVSAESVVDTIGLYVGMSLFSKEFRATVGSEVQQLFLPVRDKIGSLNADYKDREVERNLRKANAIIKHFGKEPSALENCDPPVSTSKWDRPKVQWAKDYIEKHYEGENAAKHAARMKMKADEIAMAKNHGRIPLNPETAALQKLNLMHNYYEQSHDPSLSAADVVKLTEQYEGALSTLGKLMEHDKVNITEMNQSFRTIVGQLTAVHPEYECEFSNLVYDNVVKADGKETEAPSPDSKDIRVCYTWQGEYLNSETGELYDSDFSVREVMDKPQHMMRATQSLYNIYSKMQTADDLFAAMNSTWFVKAQKRYESIMGADFKVLDARDPLDRPRDAVAATQECFNQAMEYWVYGRGGRGETPVDTITEIVNGKRVTKNLYEGNHYGECARLVELLQAWQEEEKQRTGRNADFGEFDVSDAGENGGYGYGES